MEAYGGTTRQPNRRAELHLHFEGAIEIDVLNKIGRRVGLEPLQPHAMIVSNWVEGDRIFAEILARLRDRDAYRDAAAAMCDRLVRERIVYAEISLMPAVHVGLGVPFHELWTGIAEALAARDPGEDLRLRFLFAIPRNGGAQAGYDTLRLVEQADHPDVLGIDLAGTEADATIAPFAAVFDEARRLGLRTVAHAGEFGPAQRVRDTLRLLRPDRIGHGLAAAQDRNVLQELAESGVPLDMSPTGNIAFGAVPSLADHPFRKIHDAGVPITISTDDPAMIEITLEQEFANLSTEFGLSPTQVETVAQNAFRYGFATQGLEVSPA